MFKLAVFDLDGTLLDKDHNISDANVAAIDALKARGVKIMIATGRPDMLVKEYVKRLNIETPVISCNGAVVRNPFKKTVLLNKLIEKDYVKEIIEICQHQGHIYMAYSDGAIVTTDNYRTQYFLERNKTLDEDCRGNFVLEEDPAYISQTYPVNKILVIERDEDKYKGLHETFKKFKALSKVQSSKGFYDIMPDQTSKMNAIDHVIDHYNIDISQVVAFGDNYNDLAMLEHVGVAITMANGVQAVKAIADYISIDHNDSGVAHAINTYILKEEMEA